MNVLANLRGALTLGLIVLNTVLWGVPLLLLALVKLITPGRGARFFTDLSSTNSRQSCRGHGKFVAAMAPDV